MNGVFARMLAVALAVVVFSAGPLFAGAAKVMTQVPGYYRLALGDYEVTALYDGTVEIDAKLLAGGAEEELKSLLARHFMAHPKMPTSVNAYLVNTGQALILVDAGSGALFGPAHGKLPGNLKAAGYAPEDLDMVVLTHLHGDHMGGLVTAEGKPVFPKAQVLVAKAENDYWLSEDNARAAPEGRKRFFEMAGKIAAALSASGQWRTFEGEAELAPGLRAVAAPGHTPGHTAYAVESDGQRLVIWGDLIHAHAVQFARPGVTIGFDSDQKMAAATRLGLMRTVAADKTLVAGMHLPFPGFGHVRSDGPDVFAWVPLEYAPLPAPGGK